MDRLPLVALLLLPTCSDGGGSVKATPSRSRVNAVAKEKTAEPAPVDLSAFCDQRDTSDAAPKLTWPELRKPAGAGGTPRWINVWATWCAPCVAELPRLAEWKQELTKKVDYELVFVSADGAPDDVKAFAAKHPEVEGTLELADAAALTPWLEGMGIKGVAGLPVHLFVDAQDRIRCARMSEVGVEDKDAVTQLLASMQ